MDTIPVKVRRTEDTDDIEWPVYQTTHSAGMDLRAAVKEDLVLEPGQRDLVPTGLSIALPDGYEAQIRPRSGLAIKHGISMVNTPGTIDADYRGEIKVIIINHGTEGFVIRRGDRIAQMVINKIAQAAFEEVDELPESGREDGGFGSTGKR